MLFDLLIKYISVIGFYIVMVIYNKNSNTWLKG